MVASLNIPSAFPDRCRRRNRRRLPTRPRVASACTARSTCPHHDRDSARSLDRLTSYFAQRIIGRVARRMLNTNSARYRPSGPALGIVARPARSDPPPHERRRHGAAA